MRSNISRGS